MYKAPRNAGDSPAGLRPDPIRKAARLSLRAGIAVLAVLATAGLARAEEDALSLDDVVEEGTPNSALENDISKLSNDEIARRLENPLTNLWSLTFQENYANYKGDAVNGDRTINTAFFQPALPIPVGDDLDKIFIARPVIPWVKRPDFKPDPNGGTSGDVAGLGDIQAFAMIGPNRLDGTVWGVGATFKFPTAEDDQLGAEKWQAGPAAMLFRFTKTWTTGALVQHWNSFAGDGDRDDTSQTDIQYVIRRQLGNGWSIGMGPTITIDWKADNDNKYTVPVGLGVTKTFRFANIPWKVRLEPQYSIVRPDDFGEEWNIRLQIAPVLQSPFSKGMGR